MGGMGAAGVGVLLVEEDALGGEAGECGEGERLAAGAADLVFGDLDLAWRAIPALRRRHADRLVEVLDGIEQGRAAHHHRARMIGAVAVADIGGRAVEDAGDAVHRDFERIRRDLGEHGLDALADRRGAHEHRHRAVRH